MSNPLSLLLYPFLSWALLDLPIVNDAYAHPHSPLALSLNHLVTHLSCARALALQIRYIDRYRIVAVGCRNGFLQVSITDTHTKQSGTWVPSQAIHNPTRDARRLRLTFDMLHMYHSGEAYGVSGWTNHVAAYIHRRRAAH